MKFLFIIQGEGRGHLTEAIALSQILQKNGHLLICALIGKSPQRKIPEFVYQKINSEVITFRSPNFLKDKKNKKIHIFRSLVYNLLYLPQYSGSIKKINKTVQSFKPDVIINFYDVLGGLYNGLMKPSVPFLCIGHHYFMEHSNYQMPKGFILNKAFLKLHNKLTSLRAKAKIGLSWYPAGDELNKKLFVCPPLLRNELTNYTTKKGDHLLVYLLNSGFIQEIITWHIKNSSIPIHLFTDKIPDKSSETIFSNLIVYGIDDEKFIQSLAGCFALATTAGFEAPAEAIFLNKPILMVPVENHFEQYSNACDAEMKKIAIQDSSFNLDRLIYFSKEHNIQENLLQWISNGNDLIMKIILQHTI